MLERLHPAQVDGPRDLGRVAPACSDLDAGTNAGGRRGRAQLRREVARVEERRVDPLCKLRRVGERLLHVASHLLEELLRRSRIGVQQSIRQLQVDRERDQPLLGPVVELALDQAPVGIGGEDEPLAGRLQLFDLEMRPSLQQTTSSARGEGKLSVIASAASSDRAPRRSGGQPPGALACWRRSPVLDAVLASSTQSEEESNERKGAGDAQTRDRQALRDADRGPHADRGHYGSLRVRSRGPVR